MVSTSRRLSVLETTWLYRNMCVTVTCLHWITIQHNTNFFTRIKTMILLLFLLSMIANKSFLFLSVPFLMNLNKTGHFLIFDQNLNNGITLHTISCLQNLLTNVNRLCFDTHTIKNGGYDKSQSLWIAVQTQYSA